MNFVKFLYDLIVYLTVNYSKLPDELKQRFSEESFVSARLFFRILLIVIRILIYILSVMNKNKTVVVILEIAKYIISALLGYFGGNAIM